MAGQHILVFQFTDLHGTGASRIYQFHYLIYLCEVMQCDVKGLGNQKILTLLASVVANLLNPEAY